MATLHLKLVGALAVLAAGTGLGTLLASFVAPAPLAGFAAPAPASGATMSDFAPVQGVADDGLDASGPFARSDRFWPDGYVPDGYVPDGYADEQGSSAWQYPEPELPAWEPAPFPRLSDLRAARAQAAEPAAPDDGSAENPLPSVPLQEPRRPSSRLTGLY